MLQVGDRVRVKAKTGGPDVPPRLAHLRLALWGCIGIVTAVVPYLDRPIVVAFDDPDVPPTMRFWDFDLLEVEQ